MRAKSDSSPLEGEEADRHAVRRWGVESAPRRKTKTPQDWPEALLALFMVCTISIRIGQAESGRFNCSA
jgi:hypothetical protein